MQHHMTLECSLEQFWCVAFLVSGVMAMKRAPFSLTCVVADSFRVFCKRKYEHTSTDFSQVLKEA